MYALEEMGRLFTCCFFDFDFLLDDDEDAVAKSWCGLDFLLPDFFVFPEGCPLLRGDHDLIDTVHNNNISIL